MSLTRGILHRRRPERGRRRKRRRKEPTLLMIPRVVGGKSALSKIGNSRFSFKAYYMRNRSESWIYCFLP